MNDGGGQYEVSETSPTTNEGANAKYITKQVHTKDPIDEIRVFVDMIKTINNKVDIFVKDKPNNISTDFDTISYKKLTRQDELISTDSNDIVTEEFRISGLNTDAFAIKLVMTGSDRLNVPRIKGMRVIGLGG